MRVIRNKRINISFIFCITAIFVAILLFASDNIGMVSAQTVLNINIDAKSKIMTESINFELNGVQKSLLDYPDYLHTRFELDNRNNDNLNVADEWIENIVPMVLFKQKIKDYLYIGDEYGFYFDYNISDGGTYAMRIKS